MAFAAFDDVTLHYAVRAAGTGAPTIAFSNSLGTDFRIWEGVVSALPEDWGVLLYDKRGHGLSDLSETPDALDAHVGDLLCLLDHTAIPQAVVCGLSVGGVIAQGLAARANDRVAALILSNTAAKVGNAADWEARIAKVNEGGIEAIAEAVLARWFAPAFHEGSPAILSGMRNMLTRQDARSYAAICAMLRDTDLREAAGRIRAPTLMIAGEHDGATPPDLVKETGAMIEGSEFRLIDGVGHIPCVEVPKAVASHITDFVGRRLLS